jgi:hypothetical protein
MDRHRAQLNLSLPDDADHRAPVESRHPGVPLMATEEMRAAKAWLENVRVPAQPDPDLLAIHGWLSPDGTLFACGWEQHNELTAALGFRHESEIEAAGYCKLTALRWLVETRYCQHGLTENQWATIEKWYARNGFPEEHFLRLCGSV